MEGRWAQLTVDAHIAHAIDYSRPVKPCVERAIHKALLTKRRLYAPLLYPSISEDGHQILLTTGYIDKIVKEGLFPWESDAQVEEAPQENIQDRINYLLKVQADLAAKRHK